VCGIAQCSTQHPHFHSICCGMEGSNRLQGEGGVGCGVWGVGRGVWVVVGGGQEGGEQVTILVSHCMTYYVRYVMSYHIIWYNSTWHPYFQEVCLLWHGQAASVPPLPPSPGHPLSEADMPLLCGHQDVVSQPSPCRQSHLPPSLR
jgi:hypothetical protein